MSINNLNVGDTSMVSLLSKTWWILLLRGLAAIIFGLLIWFQPAITIMVLVIFFGAYTLVEGIFGIIAAFQSKKTHPDWWLLLLWSLVSIIVGILTFILPIATAYALLCLIAAWAIISGIFQIATAVKLRKQTQGEVWLILGGILSVLFGIALFVWPLSGALAIAWLIGIYAMIFGVINLIVAFRVYKLTH